jgi:hypothetical protein
MIGLSSTLIATVGALISSEYDMAKEWDEYFLRDRLVHDESWYAAVLELDPRLEFSLPAWLSEDDSDVSRKEAEWNNFCVTRQSSKGGARSAEPIEKPHRSWTGSTASCHRVRHTGGEPVMWKMQKCIAVSNAR